MNSGDDDDIDGVSDASVRLTDLGVAASGAPVTVTTNVPRITFTPSGATGYKLTLSRKGAPVLGLNAGIVGVQDAATVLAGGAPKDGAAGEVILNPVDTAAVEPMEFVVAPGLVKVGDVFTITPFDDMGYVGTATTIEVADNVAPTTVLQESYGLGNNANASGAVVKYGDGGELSANTNNVVIGTPYLSITAGLLDNIDRVANNLNDELCSLNTVDTTSGNAYIPSFRGVYDHTAWSSFNVDSKLARTVGVAFSEDVDLNGTTPATTSISSTLSNWKVNNDVVVNDAGGVVNADLIDFDVNNVLTLANTDTGGVIDFTGIQDTAKVPNKATDASNAKVVVLDKMPPFVTAAEYDSSNLIVKFNEPVRMLSDREVLVIDAGDNNRICQFNTGDDTGANPKWSLSDDKMTLTVDAAECVGVVEADFDEGEYKEAVYGDGKYKHTYFSYSAVRDLAGNDWDAATVKAPLFALANTTPVFAITTTDPRWSYDAATNTLTASITTNQPMTYFSDLDAANATLVAAQGYDIVGDANDKLEGAADGGKIQDMLVLKLGNGTYIDESNAPAEGGENNTIDADADGNVDYEFNTDDSTIAMSNGDRTLTITLKLAEAAANSTVTVDEFFDKSAATDFGSITMAVAKGNASDDSETNRRLTVTINR
jgi:hypothetical protein